MVESKAHQNYDCDVHVARQMLASFFTRRWRSCELWPSLTEGGKKGQGTRRGKANWHYLQVCLTFHVTSMVDMKKWRTQKSEVDSKNMKSSGEVDSKNMWSSGQLSTIVILQAFSCSLLVAYVELILWQEAKNLVDIYLLAKMKQRSACESKQKGRLGDSFCIELAI